MTREEMIDLAHQSTNAERQRRGLANSVPREFYEGLSDEQLQQFLTSLQAVPRDTNGNLLAPWERGL